VETHERISVNDQGSVMMPGLVIVLSLLARATTVRFRIGQGSIPFVRGMLSVGEVVKLTHYVE